MRLTVKPGVRFTTIAPSGFRLLGAIEQTTRRLNLPLVITCACEAHPPNDPHTSGEAFDVRSHGLTTIQKVAVLREVLVALSDGDDDVPLQGVTPGMMTVATRAFYGQLEAEGGANEHLHFQRRKGCVY